MNYKKIKRSQYHWYEKLTDNQNKLIDYIEGTGGDLFSKTKQNKTVRLLGSSGNDFGYINLTVHDKHGIMGYRSPESDCKNGIDGFWNGCNQNQVQNAEDLFIKRYSLRRGTRTYRIDYSLKNGVDKHYLIIEDLNLAVKVWEFSEIV